MSCTVQMFGWFRADAALRLPAESLQCLRIFRKIIGKEFQRDKAAEVGVFCFVNHTHAPAAEFLNDAVMGDRLSEECVGTRHGAVILGCDYRQVNESDPLFGSTEKTNLQVKNYR